MKFKREEILAAFEAVASGLATKKEEDSAKQTQSLQFIDGYVQTFNDKVSVSYPLPAGWKYEGAVHASEITKILRRMKTEMVDFKKIDGGLEMFDGHTTVVVKLEAKVIKYRDAVGNPPKWVPLPKDFWTAVEFASFCATNLLAFPIYTFVHVIGDEVEAADDCRILIQRISREVPEMFIPASVVSFVAPQGCIEAGRTQGWLHFRNKKNVAFSCRTATKEAKYPDLSKSIDVKGAKITLPKGLEAGIDKALDIFDPKDVQPYVEIAAANGKLELRAEGPYAKMTEAYTVPWKDKVRFCMHPTLLRDALGIMDSCTVSKDRIRMASKDKGFIHVVAMLIPESAKVA